MPRSYSPSTERRAAGTVIGHSKNFHSLPGTKATWGQCPDILRCKFLNASAWRSDCFPLRPNGVTIRSQGTKAPVKTLVARDRRSPLTTWRMSRDSQRFLLQGRLFSTTSGCADSQKRRSPVPFRIASRARKREGWTPMLALSRHRYAQPHRHRFQTQPSDRSKDWGETTRVPERRVGTLGEP